MEKKDLMAAMRTSISEVLETMFFLPIDFLEARNFQALETFSEKGTLAAKLNFQGVFSGYCVLHIPEKVAAAISADFMGHEPSDLTDEQISGTVKEITNMIVGNTFSLLDETKVFDLTVPELVNSIEHRNGVSSSESELFIGIQTLEDLLAFQMIVKIK